MNHFYNKELKLCSRALRIVFCEELGLMIEIDGNSHFNNAKYDRFRQDKLQALGYTLLRFSEGEVIHQIDQVAGQINHAVYCLKGENPD
jgi:very-short-patch-repair endonuclease